MKVEREKGQAGGIRGSRGLALSLPSVLRGWFAVPMASTRGCYHPANPAQLPLLQSGWRPAGESRVGVSQGLFSSFSPPRIYMQFCAGMGWRPLKAKRRDFGENWHGA